MKLKITDFFNRGLLMRLLVPVCLMAATPILADPTVPVVTGGGVDILTLSDQQGQYFRLDATAYSGFYFAGWTDGDFHRSRIVRDNGVYTPVFQPYSQSAYNVSGRIVSLRRSDTVGVCLVQYLGRTDVGPQYQLTAVPQPGYVFHHWSDLLPQSPYYSDSVRTVELDGSASLIPVNAIFMPLARKYTMQTQAGDYGSVSLSAPQCLRDQQYRILATANQPDYFFDGWYDADGNLISCRNPYVIYPTDQQYDMAAHFLPANYTVMIDNAHSDVASISADAVYSACGQFTLSASPATSNYVFSHWDDDPSCHSATRTFNIHDSLSTAAVFNIRKVALQLTPDHTSEAGQIVLGDYDICNDNHYAVYAQPVSGYRFAGWSDGSVRNPRYINPWSVQQDEQRQITAEFIPTAQLFTVDTLLSHQHIHLVSLDSCSGTYTLSADYPGFNFYGAWLNPDSTEYANSNVFTFDPSSPDTLRILARFDPNKYAHSFTLSPAMDGEQIAGKVALVDSSDCCLHNYWLQAEAQPGYQFVSWSDGLIRNPRYMNVIDRDTTLYAVFSRQLGHFYAAGTQNIAGQLQIVCDTAADCQISFTVNVDTNQPEFRFHKWSDNSALLSRVFVPALLPEDSVIRLDAEWQRVPYAFAVIDSDIQSQGGRINIVDSAESVCDTLFYQIQAVAQPDYYFIGWTDGELRNPRIWHPYVTDPSTRFEAQFAQKASNSFLSRTLNPERGGEVSLQFQNTDCNSASYILTATPQGDYQFTGWSDGSTDNPRTVQVSSDISFRAKFSPRPHKYAVTACDSLITVDSIGDLCLPMFKIYAPAPRPDYTFNGWSDGSTDNPHIVYPSEMNQLTYRASFSVSECRDIATYLNSSCGGSLDYRLNPDKPCACEYLLSATAPQGYVFAGWSDSLLAVNPRQIMLDQVEQQYTAMFVSLDNHSLQWYDSQIGILTRSLDLSSYDLNVFIDGLPVQNPLLDHDGKGKFTLHVNPMDSNRYAGHRLLAVFSDSTGNNISGMNVTIPLVFGDTASYSLAQATQNLTADLLASTPIVVRDSAVLTVDRAAVAVPRIDVADDATLQVNTAVQVGELGIWADAIHRRYPQIIADKGITNLNNDTVNYYYTLDHKAYYPLAVPAQAFTQDMATLVGQQPSYLSYAYDGETRATGATGWYAVDDTLPGTAYLPGQGYIIYAVPALWNNLRQDLAYLDLPFVYDLFDGENSQREIDVHAYGDASCPDNNRNWNLIANPFLSRLHGFNDAEGNPNEKILHAGMLVKHLDEEGKWNGTYDWSGPMRYLTLALDGFSDYTQCRTEDAVLLPFNSYFIQSTGEGKLIFDIDQSPADLPAFVQNDNEEVTLDIALSDSLGADVTGLLISQSFTTEYEYNADLAKLIGGNEQLCVYTLDDNMMLAFMAIDPVYAAQQLIPVGYKAKSMGNKTFSLRHRTQAACDFQSVSLIDYATGIVTELLTDDYSFTPASLHDDSRFAINAVVSRMPQTPTDISDVDQDDLGKFAAMQPGIYTVLGIKVADLNQPAMQLQPGVYIIVTDNQVRKEILK